MAEKEREQGEKTGVASRESRPPLRHSQRDNPFGFVRRFAEQMDRLFEDFGFGGALSPRMDVGRSRFGEAAWAPDVDVLERDGNIVIRADLPGIKRDEIQVELRDNALWISGERKHEEEQRQEGYYRIERNYGSFARAIPLPEGTDVDKAQASFRDGVLEVTLPAPTRRGARRIEVKEGQGQQAKRAS